MGATGFAVADNDESSQATLYASDPHEMRHQEKADAIQKRILELNPNVRVSQWKYVRQLKPSLHEGDHGYGKAVVSTDLLSHLSFPHLFLPL